MTFKVLLTTPDYLPKLGGLTTYTLQVEKALKKLDLHYELLVWNSLSDLKKKTSDKKKGDYDYILNVHYQAGYFLKHIGAKQVNFIHGSEILFYSLRHK